jgi:glycosyltransferase involved in cell wall biosynthesis
MSVPMSSQARNALGRRRSAAHDPSVARSLVGLANVPTIVALGPFDVREDAYQLAAAFTSVQRTCPAQLVLLGTGLFRSAVARYALDHDEQPRVHLAHAVSPHRWSELLAAADVLVPSTSSGSTGLLEALAIGRPVVASANAVSARLLMPSSAGLIYRQGDVPGMAQALLRLLTTPALRQGMGTRATQVARRQRLQGIDIRQHDEGEDHG